MSPEIRTERLILRSHRLDDFGDALAMWSDPDVTRFIGAPNNLASIRVAQKCGYREFKRSQFNGNPVLFFDRGAIA